MFGRREVPRTQTLTLTLTPTQGTRKRSGQGGTEHPLGGKRCVGRAQIDAQMPTLDEDTFWTSWVC